MAIPDPAISSSAESQPNAPSLEALGRLLTGVTHEFNNLLTAIQIYAGLLCEHLPEEHPERHHALEIRLAAEQGSTLVAQLMALARPQALRPQVVDLDQVVAGLGDMLQRLIGEDIELRHQSASAPAWVRVDPAQMRQVILNLALNARDAMPGGGGLTLATSHHEISPEMACRRPGLQPGPCVRLTVTDTGLGVEAQVRQHLFEPFFSTKEEGKGSGLGLATVYDIVQKNGGSIWLESAPGEGATVSILLPQADAPPPELVEEPAREPRGAETLLVVEDAEVVQRALVAGLAEYGYRVLPAADGAQALRLAEQQRGSIDLVVTDLVLPGMNGRELAWRLDPSHAAIPVLYISGYSDAVTRRQMARELIFTKPFTAALLARRVRAALDARARRQAGKSA